ncbi:hypothetical protein KEM56_007003 [Ascosphaera pollenicola]|nr:hypothetical protein KEM56_007003 [Ascosphaera pollenicola]
MALPPKWYQVIAAPEFLNRFKPNDNDTGLVVSMFTTGAFCGAFFAGPTGDRFGRRIAIVTGALVFILGGGIQTGAQTIHYLWGGRFVAGLGVGMLVMIVPLYQAELAHPKIRGRVTALQQFMLGIGSLIACWVGYGAFTRFADDNQAQWRLPLGIQLAPAVVLALLIMFFPESPRWLIDHDQQERGLQVLAQLHAHGDTQDAWVQEEYHKIETSIAYEHENEASSYLELFQSLPSFRRLLLACALQAGMQMTGVSAIQYYSVTIYGQMGISGADTLKWQGVNAVVALAGQLLCMLMIDHSGRRWVLIGGNIANCIMFIIATVLLALFPPVDNNKKAASVGFIAVTWIYNFSYSAFGGPLSWIIPAEIFDTRTRSKGVSIATMISFAFNTMIGQVTPIGMGNVGYHFYILFIVCNATNALFFWAFVPETAGVPLEDMSYLFEHAPWFVPPLNMKDYRRPRDVESKIDDMKAETASHEEVAVKE